MSITREPIQFQDVWNPYRPLATDFYNLGVYPHSREAALKRRHIQPNSDHSTNLLVFDIDHPDALMRALWDRDGWRPNWVAENPDNGHAHAIYALKTGVKRDDGRRVKPLVFMAAVEEGLRRSLDADPAYNGTLVKNPIHPDWHVYTNDTEHPESYELRELAEPLIEVGFMPPRDWRYDRKGKPREIAGYGRNCTLYEVMRKEAYPVIHKYFGDADGLEKYIYNVGLSANVDLFTTGLPAKEVEMIARSITRWIVNESHIWKGGKAKSDKWFSDVQTARSARASVKRTQAKDELIKAARDAYRASGGTMTNKQIADGVGMSIKWVEKHRAAIKG